MKQCTVCNQTKPFSEYYRSKAFKSGLDSRCKCCRKQTNAEYYKTKPHKFKEIRERYEDGMWYVYVIPANNYAGMTKNLSYRMHQHRYLGRDVEYQIVFKSDRFEIAKLIEDWHHAEGWEGAAQLATQWINNGVVNKRIHKTKQIPQGWTRGQVKKSK